MPKFRVGDKVIFRLGERENIKCDNCNWRLWNTKDEQFLVDRSNQDYPVLFFYENSYTTASCPECFASCWNLAENRIVYALTYKHVSRNIEYAGFWAYESELTSINQPNPIISEGRFR